MLHRLSPPDPQQLVFKAKAASVELLSHCLAGVGEGEIEIGRHPIGTPNSKEILLLGCKSVGTERE